MGRRVSSITYWFMRMLDWDFTVGLSSMAWYCSWANGKSTSNLIRINKTTRWHKRTDQSKFEWNEWGWTKPTVACGLWISIPRWSCLIWRTKVSSSWLKNISKICRLQPSVQMVKAISWQRIVHWMSFLNLATKNCSYFYSVSNKSIRGFLETSKFIQVFILSINWTLDFPVRVKVNYVQ